MRSIWFKFLGPFRKKNDEFQEIPSVEDLKDFVTFPCCMGTTSLLIWSSALIFSLNYCYLQHILCPYFVVKWLQSLVALYPLLQDELLRNLLNSGYQ